MRTIIAAIAGAASLLLCACTQPSEAATANSKPTIVLVHGAFADASSWNGVIGELEHDGYRVIAAANPLRGVASDAGTVSAIVRSVHGPVLLVGHSYGGPVITEAASHSRDVRGLVYVAGFAPDVGESSASLSTLFPGSTLGQTLTSVALSGGGEDLYIDPLFFHRQFAADVSDDEAALMAATQRPITRAALQEVSTSPSWKTLPSYMIWGSADRNIPPRVMQFMAARAHARTALEVQGASHALMVSYPHEVAMFIEAAARDSQRGRDLHGVPRGVGSP